MGKPRRPELTMHGEVEWFGYALQQTWDFKRRLFDEESAKCTKKDRDFFKRVYPDGIPDEAIDQAIDLAHRTHMQRTLGLIMEAP